MSLDIPDEALHAGWSEYRYPRPAVDEPTDRFKRGLAAAVPLVVAAELERLADEYELNAREADDRFRDHINVDNQTGATIATVTSEINDAVADHLRECALELRGGTHD